MKELVKIQVGIRPIFHHTPTKYKILIDNTPVFESHRGLVSEQVQQHNLSVELDPGQHVLGVRIEPTNLQFENIEITSVSFNDQPLREADLYLMSKYHLDQARDIDGVSQHILDQCKILGWAGTYEIAFSSPVMPWIIRNL